jgi:hypothetical protein
MGYAVCFALCVVPIATISAVALLARGTDARRSLPCLVPALPERGERGSRLNPFLGNVTWDKDGVNINIRLTVKNTGKIPALYVARDARLVADS